MLSCPRAIGWDPDPGFRAVRFWQRQDSQARSNARRAAILWIQRGRAWVRASSRAEACLQALCRPGKV